MDGIFYPADKAELTELIVRYLSESSESAGKAGAIVSPHAAYEYTGRHIASAFRSAEGRSIETVVIIAPVHREPDDAIFLTESASFMTPLGPIAVDTELTHDLETCSTRIYRNDIPHLEEHAVEVHLPFIQHLFPKASIVPILMGRTSVANSRLLSNAIRTTFDGRFDRTLIVVSSNLSTHGVESEARNSAARLIEFAHRRDWEGLIAAYQRKEVTACGAGCVASLLLPGLPVWNARPLDWADPEPPDEDFDKYMLYGAIVFE